MYSEPRPSQGREVPMDTEFAFDGRERTWPFDARTTNVSPTNLEMVAHLLVQVCIRERWCDGGGGSASIGVESSRVESSRVETSRVESSQVKSSQVESS